MLKLLGVLGAAFALWFIYMVSVMNRGEYAYRLTITVNTPSGIKGASNVVRIFQDDRKGLLPNTGGGTRVCGEAIFIDLGDNKNLIALLPPDLIATEAFSSPPRLLSLIEIKALVGKVELRRALVPNLLTFSDLNDPSSARIVYGIRWRQNHSQGTIPVFTDDFSTVFGSGYGFRSAIIEIVDAGIWPLNRIGITGEPVTQGLEKKLLWWGRPLPWLKRISSETLVDTRPPEQILWKIEQLKRGCR